MYRICKFIASLSILYCHINYSTAADNLRTNLSADCFDQYEHCEEYDRTHHFCSSDTSLENKRFLCAATCGVCPEPTTEAPEERKEKSEEIVTDAPQIVTEPFEDGSFESSETDRPETTVEEVVEESTHPATIESEVTEIAEDVIAESTHQTTIEEKSQEITTKGFEFDDDSFESSETEHPEATTEEVAISSSTDPTKFAFETEPIGVTTDLFQTTRFYYSPEEEMDDSITTTDLPQPNTSFEPESQNETTRPLSGCYDDYENCERFNFRYNFCEADVSDEFKRFVCLKTCGLCIETTTSTTTSTTELPTTTTKKNRDDPETSTTEIRTTTEATTTPLCEDDYENCDRFDKRYNFCASNISIEFKRMACERTCNLCNWNGTVTTETSNNVTDIPATTQPIWTPTHSKLPTTQEVVTSPPRKCYDAYGLLTCIFQDKAYKHCTVRSEYEIEHTCRLTCGRCTNPTVNPPKEDECFDYLDLLDLSPEDNTTCEDWRNSGICTDHWYSHKAEMFCKKSCGLCNEQKTTTPEPTPKPCFDNFGTFQCIYHNNAFKYCSGIPHVVQEQCNMTCGMCPEGSLPPHPGPDSCIDYLDTLNHGPNDT
ncbi:hypothetical protein WR25_12315 [Diploscapter pachys]|uniref:ShKT domain-containing protein n=1 Tax=Diploscapter pachys TaxID=2018661 RepID=A0A2A2JVD7_9BILA|nr:hypothetical protein WR25_12315 [Diploscapter pachys]